MRPRLIGISLLALICGFAPAAVAEPIQNPTLLFGSVPWDFSTRTNTFSGEGYGYLPDSEIAGYLTLRAKFDDEGNFKTGKFEYRALDHHPLLLGHVVGQPGVRPIDEDITFHYQVRFEFDFQQNNLPFPVDRGVLEAYVCDPTPGDCGSNGPTSPEGVFTTDYTDAEVPLHNYLFTFHDDVSAALFLLAAVAVPAPAPGVLLGIGMVILVAMRLRRLT